MTTWEKIKKLLGISHREEITDQHIIDLTGLTEEKIDNLADFDKSLAERVRREKNKRGNSN